MELDVLTGGDVADVAGVGAGHLADLAELGRGELPAGDLDADHEVPVVGSLTVDAVPLESLELVLGDVVVVHPGVAHQILPDVQAVLLALDAFLFRFLGHSTSPQVDSVFAPHVRCRAPVDYRPLVVIIGI